MIITADWHLRSTPARCRQEKWFDTQKRFLFALCQQKQDIVVVGDIFNSADDYDSELITLIQTFAKALYPHKLYILAGNHDLKFHSIANFNKSAISILLNSHNIYPISKLNIQGYSISAPNFNEEVVDADVVFLHYLICAPNEVFPNGKPCEELHNEIKAKYIFTGDNHHAFNYKNIYNPGAPIRQTIDLLNYTPKVIMWEPPDEPSLVDFVYDSVEYLVDPTPKAYRIDSVIEDIQNSVFCDFETMLNNEMALLPAEEKAVLMDIMSN